MNFKITNKLLLCAGLVLSTNALAIAAPSTPAAAPTAAKAELAIKTEWASGLKEPQGMAIYKGEILITDYEVGKILRYSHLGKLIGILVEGLKGPSQITIDDRWGFDQSHVPRLMLSPVIYVSERKANRIIEIGHDGKITPIGEAIEEPLGLIAGEKKSKRGIFSNKRSTTDTRFTQNQTLFAVSHTTSKIMRWDGESWTPLFTPTEADRYGYRCLAYDNGTLLLSDEENGEILMLSQSGRLSTWVKGIADPSGIAIGPDGFTYICDESAGGRLWRVNNIGEKTLVAQGLGRPRGVLFLSEKTALVSDRNGKVWKLVWPQSRVARG